MPIFAHIMSLGRGGGIEKAHLFQFRPKFSMTSFYNESEESEVGGGKYINFR